MGAPSASNADWSFRQARAGDINRLMRWFPDAQSIRNWGGPNFRFPFTRHSFAEDMHWGRMASYSICNAAGELAAFGQVYERYGRINLARLVVNPERRGAGLGRRLIRHLMDEGGKDFDCDEFSLFVYRDNVTALRCYQGEGFRIADYPDDMPLADECYYLTRGRRSSDPGTDNNDNRRAQ